MKALNIIHEDHPGLLAEVTTLLEKEGIAVQDFAGLSVGNTAVLSLTVENSEQVFRMLSDAGYRVIASEHLLVRLEKQRSVLELEGRIVWEGDLDALRQSRTIAEDREDYGADSD